MGSMQRKSLDMPDEERAIPHGKVQIWALGDFNYNGTVNTIDFNLLAANFAKSGLAPAAAAIAAKSPAPQQPQRSIASEIFSDDEMIQ